MTLFVMFLLFGMGAVVVAAFVIIYYLRARDTRLRMQGSAARDARVRERRNKPAEKEG